MHLTQLYAGPELWYLYNENDVVDEQTTNFYA